MKLLSKLTRCCIPDIAGTGVHGEILKLWPFDKKELREAVQYFRSILLQLGSLKQGFIVKYQVQQILNICRYYGCSYREFANITQTLFPQAVYVRLKRRDTVAQAISYVTACQTEQWQIYDPPRIGVEPKYSKADVSDFLQLIKTSEELYKPFMDDEIQEIYYEDLVANLRDTLCNILEKWGIELQPDIDLNTREQKLVEFKESKERGIRQHQTPES